MNREQRHKKKREWLKSPYIALKRSLWKKSYSTPIYVRENGSVQKACIVFTAGKDGTKGIIHLWSKKHTFPLRVALTQEIDNIGKIEGTGWQAL